MTPAERLETLLRWLFGDSVPERHYFHAGDVLIAEGEALRRPALLVAEGEIEECIGSYSQESGPGETTVHVARTGDLADVQAIVSAYNDEPSQCSVHAMTDGSCYPLWRATVSQRPELDAMLTMVFEVFSDTIERQRALNAECEELANRLHGLEGDGSQGAVRMSATELLDDWDDVNQKELGRKLEAMQDDLDKAQLAAWEAKERQQEAQKALDLERRARSALEQRVIELMRQLANQGSAEADEKFPSAIRILESAELEEMEGAARRHREMAENYVTRARMLHRAFELLAADNPAISIKPDVMQLMLGEEPGPRQSSEPAQAAEAATTNTKRNTVPFDTAGSNAPASDPVRIPPSAKVPGINSARERQGSPPDGDGHGVDTPPAPGTKRSK
jgi:hypothetical protein